MKVYIDKDGRKVTPNSNGTYGRLGLTWNQMKRVENNLEIQEMINRRNRLKTLRARNKADSETDKAIRSLIENRR